METTYTILIPTTAAGDITFKTGHKLGITDCPDAPYLASILSTMTIPVAPVLQIQTSTVTIANSSVYQFSITQKINAAGDIVTKNFSYTSDVAATGGSGAAFVTALNALINNAGLQVIASAGSVSSSVYTLTVTALTGYPTFVWIGGSNLVVNPASTAGVAAVGTAAQVTAEIAGFTPQGTTTAVTTGNYYGRIEMNILNTGIEMGDLQKGNVQRRHILFVDGGSNAGSLSANYATFAIGYTNALNGYTVNAGVTMATAIAAIVDPATNSAANIGTAIKAAFTLVMAAAVNPKGFSQT